ncbi:FAD-dependent monooxygenase [Agrococcus sp. Marseille-Q4369]|uniref:FAD-dependent monooxygenase n=1 Tax=Agrococcus sp. Marseille-Q4369 TaxID=2810513 RepID=UPI0020165741|nr:FAD-dependent monooxygenase [Agrococcus sp. Marseille-Q4369]
MAERTHDCIVVGGGPAGLMLGLLLARAGVRTAVLERHGDFLRDFRGVGINLAIQDAVAAANALAPGLRTGRPSEALLHRIQRRREPSARAVQAVQRRLETGLVRVAEPGAAVPVPLPLRVLQRVPALRHLMGRFIGLGLRPEHATR